MTFQVEDLVRDRWWPDELARVTKVDGSRILVEFINGNKWWYDKDHQQFLEKETPSARKQPTHVPQRARSTRHDGEPTAQRSA